MVASIFSLEALPTPLSCLLVDGQYIVILPLAPGAANEHLYSVSKPTVAIADDHPGMLEKIALLLSEQFDVIARVSNGVAALDAVQTLKPDILILDVAMPAMHGIEAVRRLRSLHSATRVIFLTAGATSDERSDYQDYVAGLVLKGRMYTDLVPSIQAVLAGATCFPASSTEHDRRE